MKILVTGGTGVVGQGLIPELIERGHSVRLLSRHASEDAKQWKGIEAFDGDVADASSIRGAADQCEAILHLAGIVSEHPPETTFESVNVGGTRNLLDEAKRANVQRFVYVSSLGADRGQSDYHRSKLAAEKLVEQSETQWTIVRPGNVYGPGDEVISLILKMVRTLPAVPVIDAGNQEFQPLWHEDLARALARIVEDGALANRVLSIAGAELTTMNDLLRRFAEITGRSPIKVPVPMALAKLATGIASTIANVPIDETKLKMLEEENVVRGGNALTELGIEATALDRGLQMLADALPETLPEDGVGSLEHKRFWAEIRGSRHTAASLMSLVRDRITEIMPIEFVAEPGAPTKLDPGATMTGSLPLRGNFQVRVEVVEPTHVVLATIEGHPLSGIVEFTSKDTEGGVSFAVDVYVRGSNILDLIATRTIGAPAQNANWRIVVQRTIDASGGTSEGVHEEKEILNEEDATGVEGRVRKMVQTRKRESAPQPAAR